MSSLWLLLRNSGLWDQILERRIRHIADEQMNRSPVPCLAGKRCSSGFVVLDAVPRQNSAQSQKSMTWRSICPARFSL
jgi:hypothetical protein